MGARAPASLPIYRPELSQVIEARSETQKLTHSPRPDSPFIGSCSGVPNSSNDVSETEGDRAPSGGRGEAWGRWLRPPAGGRELGRRSDRSTLAPRPPRGADAGPADSAASVRPPGCRVSQRRALADLIALTSGPGDHRPPRGPRGPSRARPRSSLAPRTPVLCSGCPPSGPQGCEKAGVLQNLQRVSGGGVLDQV